METMYLLIHINENTISMGKKKASKESSISILIDERYMRRYTTNSKCKAVHGDSYNDVREKLNQILTELARVEYVELSKNTVGKWMKE